MPSQPPSPLPPSAAELSDLAHVGAFNHQFLPGAGVAAPSEQALEAFVLGETTELLDSDARVNKRPKQAHSA